MAVATPWDCSLATVNRRTNPHCFFNPTCKTLYFFPQIPHHRTQTFHLNSSRFPSAVLEEEQESTNFPKMEIEIDVQDSRPFFEPRSDDLNWVLSRLLRDPGSRELAYENYEKAKENQDFRPQKTTVKHLIRYLMNSKKWDLILTLVKDLEEYNVLPDACTCSKLVSSCVRARKFRLVRALLDLVESDRSVAVSAFDSAMAGYNKLHMFRSTILVFERMKSAGIEPSSGCYCGVMEAYQKIGDASKVLDLFHEFKKKNLDLTQDLDRIYTILCVALAQSGRAFEALGYFRDMTGNGVSGDCRLYSSLVRSFSAIREVKITEELFRESAEKKMLNDPETCLKVVLMYIEERQLEKIHKVVEIMRDAKIRVSDCILCTIVNGFSIQRGFWAAVKAYEKLTEKDCEPGQVTYALIINAYYRLGLYSKAEMVFEEMEQKGFDKCVVAYSNMVAVYGKTRRLNEAAKLVAKMKQKGCKPTIWIYNSLIDMHGRAQNVRRVEKIWKEMKRKNIAPDKVSYTSIINAYNKAKEFEKCVEFYHEFRMNGGEIDRAMAGIMIGVFSKTSRIDKLVRLLQEMKAQGAKLDGRLYYSALNALRDAGLQAQIKWLQDIFEGKQNRVSPYAAVKNRKQRSF